MPQIKPLSEFNRNQNALIEDLSHSGEPLYLTRNGSACVVVRTRPPSMPPWPSATRFTSRKCAPTAACSKASRKCRRASFTTPRTSWTSCGHSGAGSDGRRRHARSLHGLCAHVASWRTFSVSGWRSPSIAKGTCSRSSRKWAASTTPSTMRRASRFRAGGSPFPTPPSPSIT